MSQSIFYAPIDASQLKRERQKAKDLRQSQWWKLKISAGICHYCEAKFAPKELTMDHIVPLGRGGLTTKGNVVPCCKTCNNSKASKIPVENIFSNL